MPDREGVIMEWQVFGVIAALLAFLAGIIAPVLKLNSSITKLTVTMERLVQDMREQKSSSHDAHKRLWEHNDEQDAKLLNHETRINNLERK